MKLEKVGKKKVLLNGAVVSRRTLEAVGREYFTTASWERLMGDLDRYGRVHVAFVLVDARKGVRK